MIIMEAEQGTVQWKRDRRGIPTASSYSRLITKTGKPSAQATGYLHEILAEWLIGESVVSQQQGASDWMSRGTDLEAEAVRFYELQTDSETIPTGFCIRDDRKTGCSPDRIIGKDGGLEIKCPSAKVHVGYMLGVPHDDYVPQIQGCLWITGRDWWDFMSYNPALPPVIHRYERDEEYIVRLSEIVNDFISNLDVAKQSLEQHRADADDDADYDDDPFATLSITPIGANGEMLDI